MIAQPPGPRPRTASADGASAVMTTHEIPKPRVRLGGDDSWTVDYGNGATASFHRGLNNPGEYPREVVWWSLSLDGEVVDSSWSSNAELAAIGVWCRAAAAKHAPPPVESSDDFEVRRLAESAEKVDAKGAAKIFRGLLKRRTGISWSVRAARRGETITINAAPKRCIRPGVMTMRDRALLASVFGTGKLVSPCGVTIASERGNRAEAVYQIAGVTPPSSMAPVRAWESA